MPVQKSRTFAEATGALVVQGGADGRDDEATPAGAHLGPVGNVRGTGGAPALPRRAQVPHDGRGGRGSRPHDDLERPHSPTDRRVRPTL